MTLIKQCLHTGTSLDTENGDHVGRVRTCLFQLAKDIRQRKHLPCRVLDFDPETLQSFLYFTGRLDKARNRATQDRTCLLTLRSEEHTSELQSRENLVC